MEDGSGVDGDHGDGAVPPAAATGKAKGTTNNQKPPKRKKRYCGKTKHSARNKNVNNIPKSTLAKREQLARLANEAPADEAPSSDEEKKEDDVAPAEPDANIARARPPRRAAAAARVQEVPTESIEDVGSEDDALPADTDEITPDYLEQLSRRALPNQDELHMTDVDRKGRRKLSQEQKRARRMGIYCLFTTVYQSVPEDSGLWTGKGGIAVRIRDSLSMPKNMNLNTIYRILRLIKSYQERGLVYTGSNERRKEYTQHLIPVPSYEAQLIADCTEVGFGLSLTTWKVNLYRIQEGKIHVGRSTIRNTMLRMKPDVSAITKRPQGNQDPASAFCQANYRWATQILIMFGELTQEQVPEDFKVNGEWPKCFQVEHIRKVVLPNVTWFDEAHKKQRVGKIKNGKKVQTRFPRNEAGEFDPNGTYLPKGYELGMKYAKEARFMYGCTLELENDGSAKLDSAGKPLGKTLPIFEYSETMIVTNKDWLKLFWQTVKAPNALSKGGQWIENMREPGVIYSRDPVNALRDIGSTTNYRA